MSCQIQYIEDLPLESRTEKDRLTKLHLDISKRLFSFRSDASGSLDKIFKFTGDKLYVPGDKVYFNEAQNLVNIINQNVGFQAVKLIQDTPTRHYVSVDVRPDQTTETEITDIKDIYAFYKNYFGDSALVTEDSPLVDAIEEHKEVWKKLTDGVIQKIGLYLNAQAPSGDTFKTERTKKNLEILRASLKDDSTYGVIEGLSKYIMTSSHNLGNIKKRLALIESKLLDLSEDEETRKTQLKQISDFVRHSSYYYHLFDTLGDIGIEFNKLGLNDRAVDNYEVDTLESDLRQWMLSKNLFTEAEILGFLDAAPLALQDSGKMFNAFKNMYRFKMEGVVLTSDEVDVLQSEMMDILNKNMKSDGSVQQQLINTLADLGTLKLRLKDLHYEVLTEVYYPGFEKSFIPGKESIDGTETLDKKWKISKDQFKTILQVGEEDISAASLWGSAMVNVSETLPVTIANYFKEVMIEIDIENKKDIGGLQSFLTKNNRRQADETLKRLDSQAVHDNLTIDTIEIVDDTYDGTDVIESNILGIPAKYKTRKTRNLLNEYNNIAYQNNKKIFQHHVEDVSNEFAKQLLADKYALVSLKDSEDATLRKLYDLIYTEKGDVFIRNYIAKFLNNNPTKNEIKNKIQGMLYSAFYSDNLTIKSKEDINEIFDNQGVVQNRNLVDLNLDENYGTLKYVLNNSSSSLYKEYQKGNYATNTLKDRFHFTPDSLFGMYDGEAKKVLVRYTDLTYGYIELFDTDGGVIMNDPSDKEIHEFYTFSKDFTTLKDKYNINNGGFGQESLRKWNEINSTEFGKTYFNRLVNLYKEGNTNYGNEALSNREVPQVPKLVDVGVVGKVKGVVNDFKEKGATDSFYDYMKSMQIEENIVPLQRNGVNVDEQGNPVDQPIMVTRERQYINGQKVRTINAKYTTPIPLDNIETDLYKSILLYKTASNSYRGLKNNESQALLLQTILEGDTKLDIIPRKVKVKNVYVPGGGVKMKEHDVRSTKMMLSFINSYVYGVENEDFGIFGTKISAKKVAGVISGYTAFTALAWNAMTIPSNRLIALHNMRAVAKGNEFFNEQDWYKAVRVYQNNIGGFMNDFKNSGFTNQKSPLSQMIVRFNAIQGEFLAPDGTIQTKKLGEKILDNALWWTMEMVEHTNQTNSMIMMMMGYKLPSGISLWKAIEDVNVNRQDGEALIMPEEFTKELEIDFQKKLQAVNRQIHGNYAKLDKTMLQKNVITNMMMMFKKYIYDGFRSRFMEERYDQEVRDEQEGYFRTYLKFLNKEFTEVAKTQGLTAALKETGVKSIAGSLLKTSLAAWDAATFRIGSKNSEAVNNYLYNRDSVTDRQYYAAMRASYDMGNVVRMMLISVVVEAIMSGLDDEDKWTKFTLSYVDLYAKRLESDIGFFTSFTNFATGSYAGPTLDQTIKTLKQPFAGVRSLDNTAGLFKQLVSFDVINEDNEFEFSWNALDKYEKSGNGYEKGDYKIARKAQKSLISPYYQVMRLADPDDVLSYQNMTFKYTNNK